MNFKEDATEGSEETITSSSILSNFDLDFILGPCKFGLALSPFLSNSLGLFGVFSGYTSL